MTQARHLAANRLGLRARLQGPHAGQRAANWRRLGLYSTWAYFSVQGHGPRRAGDPAPPHASPARRNRPRQATRAHGTEGGVGAPNSASRRAAGGVSPGSLGVHAPLLIADVPWLLYRSYFALPKSIKGSDGQPVNALLGTVNALLGGDRGASRRARWSPASAPRRRATASRSTRPTTPTATRCPTELARAVGARARAAGELRLDDRRRGGARGRRRDGLMRTREAAGGRAWRCC